MTGFAPGFTPPAEADYDYGQASGRLRDHSPKPGVIPRSHCQKLNVFWPLEIFQSQSRALTNEPMRNRKLSLVRNCSLPKRREI